MKSKLIKLSSVLFATFLILATIETVFMVPETTAKEENETAALEVPVTGTTAKHKTNETYETLIEIAFLALTGTGFYLINARKGNSP